MLRHGNTYFRRNRHRSGRAVFRVFEVSDFDGEEELAEIEDEEKLNRIAEIFEDRYNSEFYDDDSEDEE